MSTDCPFVPSVTLLPCSYPRQSVMSKRNNNTATRSFIISPIFRVSPSQGKLHYQTSHTSQSDKTREIWPILINYLLGVAGTAQLRPTEGRAEENLVLISLISLQNISNHSTFCPINLRPNKQTGQAALSFLFTLEPLNK